VTVLALAAIPLTVGTTAVDSDSNGAQWLLQRITEN